MEHLNHWARQETPSDSMGGPYIGKQQRDIMMDG